MSAKRSNHQASRSAANQKSAALAGAMSTVDESQPLLAAPRRFWLPLSIAVFAISAVLMFYDLGHYPLWSDEADNALFGEAIARTGDLTAMNDHNINANRHGECLKNLRGRYQPPLPYYVSAPFVGTSGTGAFWPRLPYAICGLASIAVLMYWMSRSQLPAITWVVFSLGLLGNVSFYLYCRQGRYFSLTIGLSLVIVYLYLHHYGKTWKLAALTVASILLWATHYLAYAGLYGALCVDYLLFARRRQSLTARQLFWVLAPQAIIGSTILWIYNPLVSSAVPTQEGRSWLLDKLTLVWWNLRDLNSCEYGVGGLMLLAPALYLLRKDLWLIRAPLALLPYAVVVAIGSPQPVFVTNGSDIRYMAAAIPLCIFITALAVLVLSHYRWLIAVPLAIVAFETNILNRPFTPDRWRSTICQWIEELATARSTATQLAIDWIDKNMQPGQSVWVMPMDLMTYPLMYHAPQVVYAWQLYPPPVGQFQNLPNIHFIGLEAPDFIMSFGYQPDILRVLAEYKRQLNLDYILTDTLDVFWLDMTRPELFVRSFKPITNYDPQTEAVYIYRRSDVAWPGK